MEYLYMVYNTYPYNTYKHTHNTYYTIYERYIRSNNCRRQRWVARKGDLLFTIYSFVLGF
jgi:hypothetical protein